MHLLHRKGRWERRVVDPARDALRRVVKPGLATIGGLVGLTVGSAAVSSLRRRDGTESDARGS